MNHFSYFGLSYEVNLFIFIVPIRYRERRWLSMNLVLEQETGLLSYLVHLMKPKQRRAFSEHLFLVAHHDKSCNIHPALYDLFKSQKQSPTIFGW